MPGIEPDSELSPASSNSDPTRAEDVIYLNSDLLVKYLHQLNVRHIFGVPGGAIEPLFDAVARANKNDQMDMVVARHEGGAAFMADGYAREANKLGVCCATTGPGATNLLTGVASAYADNIPMLVITAQTALPKFGKQALQDSSCTAIDTVGIFRHCTKFNTLISHPDQFEHKLISAIMAANTPPRGPAHLSVPSDIFNVASPSVAPVRPDNLQHVFSISDPVSFNKLKQELNAAEKVVLFLGDNCRQGSEQILQFAEKFEIPFITGPMGKRWIDEDHPLYCGVFGFSGHEKARKLLLEQEFDLLLAVGTKLGELGTNGWTPSMLNEKLIHIDNVAQNFTRSSMARLHVLGAFPQLFLKLSEELERKAHSERWWVNSATMDTLRLLTISELEGAHSDAYPLKPQRLFYHLGQILDNETRIFIDAGNAWSWGTHYMRRRDNHGYYRIAMGFGSMGWAIGASVGSQVANPDAPHLCITGDGSYLMSGQEITVAQQQGLPLIMLILNDSSLGMVRHGQMMGGAEPIGFELPKIDFALMAEAMGIDGIRVNTSEELEALDFPALFQKRGPTLIDVRIDPAEVPPMGERVKGLATQD
ncbi:MAG: thiamine pyrophosphate-binding protein [Neptuniibacter sp.]